MPRPVRLLLVLLFVGLAVAAAVVMVRNSTRTHEPPPPPEARVKTETVDGITFEVEHEMKEGENLFTSNGSGILRFSRRGDSLLYQYGLLFLRVTREASESEDEIVEIALQDVKAGDVVRWNLTGPVLINGKPAAKHEIQVTGFAATPFQFEWKAEGANPRDTLGLAWIGPSHKLAVAHGDSMVRVWDADSKALLKSFPVKPGARGDFGLRLDVSPDGKRIAAANMFGDDVEVREWEKDDKPMTFTSEPKAKVRQVAFASDKAFLEARGDKLRLRMLDGSAAVELGTVHQQFERPFTVLVAKGLVAWWDDKKLHIGPIGGVALESEPMSAGCLAFSADGSRLAAASGDGRLSLIDVKTGKETKRLRWRNKSGGANEIQAVSYSPDGKTLAVGSGSMNGSSVRFYDVATGRERGGVGSPWVRDLAYSADGKLLAVALRAMPGVQVWNTADLVAK